MGISGLEDAITLAGGAVTLDSLPEVIPRDAFEVLLSTFYRTNAHFMELSQLAGRDISWAIVLTQSPGFSCAVHQLQDRYVIFVPIGMVARARVMARLLLRHWRVKRYPHFVRSPADKIDDEAGNIPPLLQPIFLDSLPAETFWKGILELDRSLELEAGFEQDVRELVHLAVLYLLSHEFTHVLHGHFDLIAEARSGACRMDIAHLSRGLELDADDGAARTTMWILNRDIMQAIEVGKQASWELGWLRLGYVVTMLFAISDTTRKYYAAYDVGAHNHPLIRCELFFASAEQSINEPEKVKAIWRENSCAGWLRCLVALETLNFEAIAGKFGALPPGTDHALLHTMLYGIIRDGPINREIIERVIQAAALRDEVRKLLPIYNQSSQGHGLRKEPSIADGP